MKAITVIPGTADSITSAEVPEPRAEDVPDSRAVRVKVLRVGLDGTDREVNDAEYGAAPPGCDYLILGHESFGLVEEVGPDVWELKPGDYVVALVRHPGHSLYDAIGMPDMTTEEEYQEHGISRIHGFLRERYAEIPERLIKIPPGLREVAVLLEPLSIAEKGVGQAYEIQRRVKVWRPRRAAVLGSGPLGLLTTLVLRLRGLEVVTFGLQPPPYLNSELVEALGARYVSTRQKSLSQVARDKGSFDVIFGAAGYSPLAFEAMQTLAKNGVLILSSVTGGHRRIEIPSDDINLGFVLGNKVMVGTVNASRADFVEGVRDMAMAEAQYPGWLERLITRRIAGLDNCPHAVRLLETGPGMIKTIVEVAPLP
jgi:threonine dehydrogenase-like Zn-dependent dehydrogenase